jgi:DNA primase
LASGVAAEVKSKLSVLEIVGEQVQLKKAGTTYKGLCPFHGEKTPSFVVTPGRDSWHCFGCGEGGDIFSFVMKRDGLTFPEALKRLAERAGIQIDERTSREDARKARLHEVLENAIAFYHAVLTQSKTGAPALEYLHKRGFTDETIAKFQLGWAPDGWDQMSKMLGARRNVTVAELAEVGLATARANGRGSYDKFRSRVIFPIRDAAGAAVGIGGRILPGATEADPSAPKYLNSPATPLFDKSRTLYLIERARGEMRRGDEAVLVEGYTDALMAHQAGFENVVASLGTALTPAQVAVISRYAREIVLAYDVDPAGQHTNSIGGAELFRLIGALAAEETGVEITRVRVARLPEGKDPDEVIRETPDLWREAIRTAQPIIEFLIDYYATSFDVRSARGKSQVVATLIPMLREVRDPVVRDSYLQTLGRRTGVDERVLLEALHSPQSAGGTTAPGGRQKEGAGSSGRFTADAIISAPDSIDTKAELKAVSLDACPISRRESPIPSRRREPSCRAPRRGSCWRQCSPTESVTAKPVDPAVSKGCVSSRRSSRSCTAWRSRCTRSAVPIQTIWRAIVSALESISACSPSRRTGSRHSWISSQPKSSKPKPPATTKRKRGFSKPTAICTRL